MVVWCRNTPWRQGHVLPGAALQTLGLAAADVAPGTVAVVVSHDCDIAQSPDQEPEVEVIVGNLVERVDGNYTHAKNPRRLHLTCDHAGRSSGLNLQASRKKPVPKEHLAGYEPDGSFSLAPNERATLQRWLAARYRRAAFPDEFDKRLSDTGMRERLAKILKPLGTHIGAVFFDVDEGEDRTRIGADDPYTLTVYLLYSTDIDPVAAEKAAQEAVAGVEKAFRERCFSKKKWESIEFIECIAIADRVMTVQEAYQLRQWNADHISMRAEPQQVILPD